MCILFTKKGSFHWAGPVDVDSFNRRIENNKVDDIIKRVRKTEADEDAGVGMSKGKSTPRTKKNLGSGQGEKRTRAAKAEPTGRIADLLKPRILGVLEIDVAKLAMLGSVKFAVGVVL